MMNQIPPDMDELMWELAKADEAARFQFAERYPAYAHELDRRAQAIGAFVKSRPMPSHIPPMPRMNYEGSRTGEVRMPRWVAGMAAAAVLVTVVMGTVMIVKMTTPSTVATTATMPNPQGAEMKTLESESADAGTANMAVPNRSTYGGASEAVPNAGAPSAQDWSKVPAPKPGDTPITVQSEGIDLRLAISEIARQCGMKAEIALGFKDQVVNVNLVQVPGIIALKSLGTQYGFSVLEQGENQILVIPATEGANPTLQNPTPNRENRSLPGMFGN